jgi:hypothetical protein
MRAGYIYINKVLLESMRDYFFPWAKHIMGHFEGFFFTGPRPFCPLKCPEHSDVQFWGQKDGGPIEKSQEMPQTKKNNLLHFQNQRYIGIFCPKERKRERGGERERKREREQELERERARERERNRKIKIKIKRKIERARKKAWGILFLNRLDQNEKSANYKGKSGILCS